MPSFLRTIVVDFVFEALKVKRERSLLVGHDVTRNTRKKLTMNPDDIESQIKRIALALDHALEEDVIDQHSSKMTHNVFVAGKLLNDYRGKFNTQ